MRDSTLYKIIAVLAILAAVIMAGVAFGSDIIIDTSNEFLSIKPDYSKLFVDTYYGDMEIDITVREGHTLTIRIDMPTLNEALTVYAAGDIITLNSALDDGQSVWPGAHYNMVELSMPAKNAKEEKE